MGFLILLLPVTSLVAFIGYVWLVRNAFRTSTGWGLVVLFLSPISAIIYTVKFWEESRKPFLVYSGSVAAGMAVMVMMFSSMGGFQAVSLANDMRNGEVTDAQAADFMNGQMDRMENSGMLSAQEQRDLEQMRGAVNQLAAGQDGQDQPLQNDSDMDAEPPRPRISEPVATATTTSALVQALRMRAQETARDSQQSPAGPIRVRDAKRYIGRSMTAMGTDGIEHKGILSNSDGDTLWLDKYFTGGTFSVELRKSQIRALEVHEQYGR